MSPSPTNNVDRLGDNPSQNMPSKKLSVQTQLVDAMLLAPGIFSAEGQQLGTKR